MCGIYCYLRQTRQDEQKSPIEMDASTKELLLNRGPNAHAEISFQTDQYEILFSGFVLWQQGAKLCPQPYSYKNHILLINGDIFKKREDRSLSDTEWLTLRIDECNDEAELLNLFRSLEGPYSMIYYNQNAKKIYFLRDVLGRQSLLLAKTSNEDTVLSSVLAPSKHHYTKCIELQPLGVFCINLLTAGIQLNPWLLFNDEHLQQLNELQDTLNSLIEVRPSIETLSPWLIKESFVDTSRYYNFESILKEYINHSYSYVDIFEQLLLDKKVVSVCDEVLLRLESSLLDRILNTPSVCKECLRSRHNTCNHARIGILFSGGIDCTILAVLTDKFLDPSQQIDLINVSFEKVNQMDFNTPDRVSAKKALQELKQINPNRKWNLVEVNVNRNELSDALNTRIHHLVFPLRTVLDESLGCVLWFGARGMGKVNEVNYSSNCRILLIGSGADELFAGYTRHRNAFVRQYDDGLSPFERLEKELDFDFNRLPNRNLARDDRVIGDNGISVRSPFLEERLVHFIRSLKPYQKCYHALDQGIGDKLLLRLCGFRLGLRTVSSLKKKAMQFGSRIANSKQNAKDISKSLVQI